MYYIGVDGGGTKTSFTLFDEQGRELNHVVTKTTHYAQAGVKKLAKRLKKGVQKCLDVLEEKPGHDEVCIGLGLAGYGREENVRALIEQAVREALDGYRYVIKNDAEIAMKAALRDQPGILVIAGTGSIALSSQPDGRAGGWGWTVGDEGSGYWIGKQCLEAFSKMSDGRREKTVLYDLVKETLSLSSDAAIVSYTLERPDKIRQNIAELAKVVGAAAKQNDPCALEILEKAGQELAAMVNVLAKNFASDRIIATYMGGAFKAGDALLASFIAALDEKVLLVGMPSTPDMGAYLYAKEIA